MLLWHPPWNTASPEEEQRKEQEHGNGYGLVLLVAQADGQIEPGVSSTKDYQAAPADSGDHRHRGTHPSSQPTDPTARGQADEARLRTTFTLLTFTSTVVGHWGEASEMRMGGGRGNRPALQNQRRSLLRNRPIMAKRTASFLQLLPDWGL